MYVKKSQAIMRSGGRASHKPYRMTESTQRIKNIIKSKPSFRSRKLPTLKGE